MALLQKPAVAAILAVVLGLVTSLGWLWRASQEIIASIPVPEPEAVPEIEKARGWDFWTTEIEVLSAELKQEKARLAQRAADLDARASRLDAEEQELATVRADLDAVRKEIDARVIAISADEAKNLRSLAATYSALTPRAAVQIVSELDDATVVKILALMKPDVIGPIFEEMSRMTGEDGPLARRAAELSEKLRLVKPLKAGA